MNVLITGGAGYVGSVAALHLSQRGYRVRVLDNLMHQSGAEPLLALLAQGRVDLQRGDIRERADVERAVADADAVIHLAAIVGDPACKREPDLAKTTNLDGTTLTLESARAAGVERFLFFSTCSNYGRTEDKDQIVDETSELRPLSLYAETKCTAEELVLGACTSDFIGTGLRLSTVYGLSPRMRFDLTVNDFSREAVLREKLVVFGEQFWRPYIHTADVAQVIATMLRAAPKKIGKRVFNVGANAENYQKSTIVKLLSALVPQMVVERVEQPDDPRDYRVNFDRLSWAVGFEPTRRVSDGLYEVVEALRHGVFSEPDAERFKN